MTIPSGRAHYNWRRVNKTHPCPVCKHPDWCLLSADGTAAICARVESAKRAGEAGWLHRLVDAPWQPERRFVRVVRFLANAAPRAEDLGRLAAQWRDEVDPGRLHQLAVSLGLSIESLCHFSIGWSAGHRAWSFPMAAADGNVLGIRLRRPNGFKFAVTGSKEGLFVPSTVEADSSPLVICEGPTDAAALLDMGFRSVVGRPSCTGGIKLLVELVRRRQRPDVVIAGDNDEPGRIGADNLASVLVAYAPAVRIIAPPAEIKDAREWLRAGGRRPDVEKAIGRSPVRRLAVRGRVVGLRG